MDYKGRKVWVMGVFPVVYSSNERDWAIDAVNPFLSKLLNKSLTKFLKTCNRLNLEVPISHRKVKLVKKSPKAVKHHTSASVTS